LALSDFDASVDSEAGPARDDNGLEDEDEDEDAASHACSPS
jgi:hypothetical protein